MTGVEPARLSALVPKTSVASITPHRQIVIGKIYLKVTNLSISFYENFLITSTLALHSSYLGYNLFIFYTHCNDAKNYLSAFHPSSK